MADTVIRAIVSPELKKKFRRYAQQNHQSESAQLRFLIHDFIRREEMMETKLD